MIISCEKCDTKYRLDASRLSYASVKVQCSKCDHIFIVPATGEERKKHGLEFSPPHDNNQTKGSDKPSADHEPRQGEADETAAPNDEFDEESTEENKTRYPGDEAGTSAADFSFPPEAGAPKPPQDETTEPHVEEEPEAEESVPEFETTAGTEPADETGPHEEPESSAEGADRAEENNEAPLPWEVSSNTFDLSFGAAEHKAQSEAEAGNAEEETTEEEATEGKSPETPDDLNKAPEATEPLVDEDQETDEAQGLEAPPETKGFDFEGIIDEPDESHATAPSNEVSEEAQEAPSFSEELLKAASNEDKAPNMDTGAEGTGITEEVESEPQNNTFVIPADTSPEPEPQETKKSGIGGLIAIIVIVVAIAGGLIYMKSRPESALMIEPSLVKPLEIESTKGYYVVNKEGGRIFVIETILKNITDGPVKISGIRGLVMDSSGREMARKMVSPGRIVTAEDLRNLPVETLLKSFSDTSEGTMPQKSTIPTMILFTNLQKAVAEYGIDVLR